MNKTINTDLLNRIADQIELHPETHQQDEWFYSASECGTRACIAGWACILENSDGIWITNDDTHTYDIDDDAARRNIPKYRNAKATWALTFPEISDKVNILQNIGYFSTTAEQLLGLGYGEAGLLFDERVVPRDPEMSFPDALRAVANGQPIEDVFAIQDEDY